MSWDYDNGNGMLTTIWGPVMWHYLHTWSFNYPPHPTREQKEEAHQFLHYLSKTLPCKFCRQNLKKNMKQVGYSKRYSLKNRESFSRFIYDLHAEVNRMTHKETEWTYEQTRDLYEYFRARCKPGQVGKEKGCVVPMNHQKTKCVLFIVPANAPIKSFNVDPSCGIHPGPPL